MQVPTDGKLMMKGRMLAATVRSMSSLGSLGVSVLAELGIHDIDIDAWYPAEARRAIHRTAFTRYGPEALFSFGFTTADLQYSLIPEMQSDHQRYLDAIDNAQGDPDAESDALQGYIRCICDLYTVTFQIMVNRDHQLFGAYYAPLENNCYEIRASTFADPDHEAFLRGIFSSFFIRGLSGEWDIDFQQLPEKTSHGPDWGKFHFYVRFIRRTDKQSAEIKLIESRLEAREALLKNVVEQSNRSLSVIMESIQYARLLQQGQMPDIRKIKGPFDAIDIAWQPRDLIGGDIWWTHTSPDGSFTLALVDCTGHGVPGAMLSVLAISTLERIYAQDPDTGPAAALSALDAGMRASLHQAGEDKASDDGCDAAIIRIAPDGKSLKYAGAKIDLFQRHNDEVIRHRGTRISLGYLRPPSHSPEEQTIALSRGDLLLMVTDGVTDQPGSHPERRKSFGNQRIQHLLATPSVASAEASRQAVLSALQAWQGEARRRDDVSIVSLGM